MMGANKSFALVVAAALVAGAGVSALVGMATFKPDGAVPATAPVATPWKTPETLVRTGEPASQRVLWQGWIDARTATSGARLYLGVAGDASEKGDHYDAPVPPPPPGEYVRAYFPGFLSREFRPPGVSIVWEFRVESESQGPVTLTWDVSEVPEDYALVQLTLADGHVLVSDMRIAEEFQFMPPPGAAVFRFSVS